VRWDAATARSGDAEPAPAGHDAAAHRVSQRRLHVQRHQGWLPRLGDARLGRHVQRPREVGSGELSPPTPSAHRRGGHATPGLGPTDRATARPADGDRDRRRIGHARAPRRGHPRRDARRECQQPATTPTTSAPAPTAARAATGAPVGDGKLI
jgi:hypothetical protein